MDQPSCLKGGALPSFGKISAIVHLLHDALQAGELSDNPNHEQSETPEIGSKDEFFVDRRGSDDALHQHRIHERDEIVSV